MKIQSVAASCALFVTVHAQAVDYRFVKVIDSAGPFNDFNPNGVCINDLGAVAFWADLDVPGSGIYVADGAGPVLTIADESDGFSGLGGRPSINSAGDVTFVANSATPPNLARLYLGNAQSFDLLHANGGEAVINDAGQAAFGIANASGYETLVRWQAGRLTTIASEDPGIFTMNTGRQSINESGTVAFLSQIYEGGHAVLAGAGGRLAVIDAGPDDSILGTPAINDAGKVAFLKLDGGRWRMFTGNGGPVTPAFSNDQSLTLSPNDTFALNNRGTIAFHAATRNLRGIFTGPDLVADKVIAVGDPLDGSTIQDVQFGPGGLNNRDRIAFYATLTDNRHGIWRAEPICHADATHDDVVNIDDLVLVIVYWGNPGALGGIADLNHDGFVNVDDLVAVITHWGQCP